MAELIGEEGETADVLAGADPQLRAAVEQVRVLLLSLTQCRGVLLTAARACSSCVCSWLRRAVVSSCRRLMHCCATASCAALLQVLSHFSFRLDPFQVRSVAHLLDGKSGGAAWVWMGRTEAAGGAHSCRRAVRCGAHCICTHMPPSCVLFCHPAHCSWCSHPLHPCPAHACRPAVVVCAPTGAGKTAIAEAATLHFLGRGQRVIYTTPLKALSNQKLGEMRERFG